LAYDACRTVRVKGVNMSVSVEEAIKTAIEYETKVRDVYREAEQEAQDPKGKRVLGILAEEEQDHLKYLEHKLDEWQKTGKVEAGLLETTIPSKEKIEAGIGKLEGMVSEPSRHRDAELKMLNRALQMEIETGDFYRRMVNEMPEEAQPLFQRFVEIEEGHKAMVQAELDYLNGPGYWFDFREFDLAGG
jgi:rubrerythrin